jgi:hypothetical protein
VEVTFDHLQALSATETETSVRGQRGREGINRPHGQDAPGEGVAWPSYGSQPAEVSAWRKANDATIAATATHFELSKATVKRCCAA